MKKYNTKQVNDTYFKNYLAERDFLYVGNGYFYKVSPKNTSFVFYIEITIKSKTEKIYFDFFVYNGSRHPSKYYNPSLLLHPMEYFKELNEDLRSWEIDTEEMLLAGVAKIRSLLEQKYFALTERFDTDTFFEMSKDPIIFFHDTFNTEYEKLYAHLTRPEFDMVAIKNLITYLKNNIGRDEELNVDVSMLDRFLLDSDLGGLRLYLEANKKKSFELLIK